MSLTDNLSLDCEEQVFITLKSNDGVDFKVNRAHCLDSKLIKACVMDMDGGYAVIDDVVPININSEMLKLVVDVMTHYNGKPLPVLVEEAVENNETFEARILKADNDDRFLIDRLSVFNFQQMLLVLHCLNYIGYDNLLLIASCKMATFITKKMLAELWDKFNPAARCFEKFRKTEDGRFELPSTREEMVEFDKLGEEKIDEIVGNRMDEIVEYEQKEEEEQDRLREEQEKLEKASKESGEEKMSD